MLQGKWPTFCVVSNVWVLYRGGMCLNEKLEPVVRVCVRICANICVCSEWQMLTVSSNWSLLVFFSVVAFLTWCEKLSHYDISITIVVYFGCHIHIWKPLEMLVVFLLFSFTNSSLCSALCIMKWILWYFCGVSPYSCSYKGTERLFPAFDWLDMHWLLVSRKNEFLFLGKMQNRITLGRIASHSWLFVCKSADNIMTL